MTIIWFIAWLIAAWSGDHAPVGDAWTGTLILAFAFDVAVQHTLEIRKLPTDTTTHRLGRTRAR